MAAWALAWRAGLPSWVTNCTRTPLDKRTTVGATFQCGCGATREQVIANAELTKVKTKKGVCGRWHSSTCERRWMRAMVDALLGRTAIQLKGELRGCAHTRMQRMRPLSLNLDSTGLLLFCTFRTLKCTLPKSQSNRS